MLAHRADCRGRERSSGSRAELEFAATLVAPPFWGVRASGPQTASTRFATVPPSFSTPACAPLVCQVEDIHGCYDVLQMLRWPPMNRVITQRELRNESAAVLREVEAGRTFVLTRNGTPVAELRPIQPRRFVPRAIIADAGGRAPRVDARQFRADLDAVVDQSLDE
jgi:prevent-host-death family protein